MNLLLSNIETLLLAVVILLQIVLIFLVMNREPRAVLATVGWRREPRLAQEKAPVVESENLWSNPPSASPELKSTIAEVKNNYNRNDPWDGDFVV